MTLSYVIGEVLYRLWGAEYGISFYYGLCFILCICYLVIFFLFHFSKKSVPYLLKDPVFYVLPIFLIFGSINCQNGMKSHPLEPVFLEAQGITMQGKCSSVSPKSKSVQYEFTDCIWIQGNGYEKLGTVLVTFSTEQDFEPGNIVRVKGKLSVPQPATNRGQFDQKEYYKSKGIHFMMKGTSVEKAVKGHDRLAGFLYRLRTRIKQVYTESLPTEEAGIVSAMVLGDKEYLSEEVRDRYQSAGISHILAISGLHVSMFGMFLYEALKKLFQNRAVPVSVTIAFLAAYGILTGESVSTIRAVWMLGISLAAVLIGRTYDQRSALAGVALGILIPSPLQLFQCGFQLSFGAVLSINLILPAFQACIKREKENRKQALLEPCLVSISIFLGTFPCLAYFYYEIALYSTLLNLFVLPLASLLLLSAAAGGLCGCLWLPLGRWILFLSRLILWFYKVLCLFSRNLPGHNLVTGKPGLWQIAIYYTGLFIFLWLVYDYKYRALAVLFASALVFCIPLYPKGLMVSCLDVGQGDCLFIKTPSNTTILMDGGSSSVTRVGEYRVESFLKSYGITHLDYCLLSHLDEDHINGVKELLEREKESPGEHIVLSHLLIGAHVKGEEKTEELAGLLKETNGQIVYIQAGDQLKEAGLTFRCLHPQTDFHPEDANSGSLVMELIYEDFSMLFTGDLDETGEQAMIKSGQLSRHSYDVLKAGHHGSKYSTSQSFIDAVHPSMALISYGKSNRYGHPHKETLERLKKSGCQILTTGEKGEIDLVKQKGRSLSYKTNQ
ncbi:MAG: DNA internalization-related competence protein ComEC/Rec2 [Clostridiales bacterium]|nr:DNA internalization-related competence protein ComEC/Rec2 [Clostridiales bacterium]